MKAQLAVRLLAEQMGWDDSRVTKEFAWLNLMVEYKYDHYQGYGPGSRFFVNLLSWIAQFSPEHREEAYLLIRDRLVYISQREMHHLVSLTMPRIEREARKAIATELSIPFYRVWTDPNAGARIKEMSLRTLYIGLSDGAKVDVFRRDNEGVVSNEQVVAVTEISNTKWDKLCNELSARLKAEKLPNCQPIFERICLIDDFTASGSSLIRKEGTEWKGKIPTFIVQNKERIKHILPNCIIQIHHYIGSAQARNTITDLLRDYQQEMQLTFRFNALTFSMVLSENIVISDGSSASLVALLKDYYGKSCETKHTKEDLWYGYKQCGLPAVLEHNTPNNSIGLLWASSNKSNGGKDDKHTMKPLFPRKQRHIDHGQSI